MLEPLSFGQESAKKTILANMGKTTEVVDDNQVVFKDGQENVTVETTEISDGIFQSAQEKYKNLPDLFQSLFKDPEGELFDIAYSSGDTSDVDLEISDDTASTSDYTQQFPKDAEEIEEEIKATMDGLGITSFIGNMTKGLIKILFGEKVADVLSFNGFDIEMEPDY